MDFTDDLTVALEMEREPRPAPAEFDERPIDPGSVQVNAAQSSPEARKKFQRPTPIDLMKAMSQKPPPLDFILPGLLAGTVGALVSPGGTGKSMLGLELLLQVGIGLDLCGFAAGQKFPTGKVVFLAAEDPQAAIEHRIHQVGQYLTPDQRQALANACTVAPLMGYGVNIMEPEWFEYLDEMAQGSRLVLIDTLRRVHTADENDSSEMAQVVGTMERVTTRRNTAILFLHHANKTAALNGQGDQQQASRGSSVLVDNIRWQGYLAGMSSEEAKAANVPENARGFYVRSGISKQNYGAPLEPVWMRRAEGGVLVPWEPPKKSQRELRADAAYDAADSRRQRRESKIATL